MTETLSSMPRFAVSPRPGAFLGRRPWLSRPPTEAGATRKAAICSLDRRIPDIIYRAILADAQALSGHQLRAA